MNTDLKEYIKIFPNSITPGIISASLTQLQNGPIAWQPNYFYNPQTHNHENYLGDRELDMSFDLIGTTPELMDNIRSVLVAYLTEIKMPWFVSWNGYSRIRHNRYESGKEMALHYDCIHEIFDGTVKGVPTLSIIGALNDDYEGGDLVMFDDHIIRLKAGDIMIFPSTFLYPHRVAPVTSGVRHTFVSWVW
jgi:hypothetical protein